MNFLEFNTKFTLLKRKWDIFFSKSKISLQNLRFWGKRAKNRRNLRFILIFTKERKENFLSLYISFFERNMHKTKSYAYIEHIFDMFLQRRQSLLCIRISKAYSYEDKQSLSSYIERIYDSFLTKISSISLYK